MNISILQAEHLPKMDLIGTIDAFVKTVYNKETYKTKVVNPKNNICTFN